MSKKKKKQQRAQQSDSRQAAPSVFGAGIRSGPMMANGYGNHGASRTLNSLVGWIASGGSAEDDIDLHGALLRQRARDLYAGGGLGRSGPATLVTNVVGWGIQPKPKIDGELLGMDDEACAAWERNAMREFRIWAENNFCDANRQMNFYAMQQLAFLSQLISGDVFVLFGMARNPRTPYQTTIRLLEADRVSTPDSGGESESVDLPTGGRIIDGVEIDRNGAVRRYHIANRHPLAENDTTSMEWVAVDAFGRNTGMPNVLHVMTYERPEQRRGIPFVAAQIEQIKQLDRYVNSELAANVVSSMLTTFITSDTEDGRFSMEDAVRDEEKVTNDDMLVELGPGAVYELPPGKKVSSVNPLRNNTTFEPFVTAQETLIGAGMETPKEVLIKKYDSNYTAARSALLDYWKVVRKYRNAFNGGFNQPIYEAFLTEAVALGRIDAPGFFEDPLVRQAWCGCSWLGISMGHVDPLKEIKAAVERINANVTTEEQEASEYNGNDWNANIRQRRKEKEAFSDMSAGEEKTDGI